VEHLAEEIAVRPETGPSPSPEAVPKPVAPAPRRSRQFGEPLE
jgi:hypothetical protein